jgi:hypothetical protein
VDRLEQRRREHGRIAAHLRLQPEAEIEDRAIDPTGAAERRNRVRAPAACGCRGSGCAEAADPPRARRGSSTALLMPRGRTAAAAPQSRSCAR